MSELTAKHDVAQIFLVFMALVGDAEKTAIALDLKPEFVRELANQHQWCDKVARISLLSKSGKPGDWEKAQNRALNFVQCHRLRRAIDLQLAYLESLNVKDVMIVLDRDGNPKLSARLFTDLASAMQKVHEISYNALGDSVKERTTEKTEESDKTSGGLHSAMIAALNQQRLPDATPANTLADAANVAVESLKSANPTS